MLIIGHRGAKGLALENSLESLQLALELGVDMIEVDVRLHRDEVVLSHDETTAKAEYCFLPEALRLINGKVPLIIEVKEAAAIKKMFKLLENYNGEVTFSSKKFDILQKIKKRQPTAHVAVTEGWSGVRAVAAASLLHTDEIHLKNTWLWGSFVRSMKHRGFNVFAYTVNSPERAKELEEWGVDGIFTDYPDRFV